MKFQTKYVITKPSNDGTFLINDHIELFKNGDIWCDETKAWLDANNVNEALQGTEYCIDKKRGKELVQELMKKIYRIIDDYEL